MMNRLNDKPRVIIVNDDGAQLRLAAAILKRDNFEVISCRGAEEALRVLNLRGAVDLIVTDLSMPGIDGWRFCRLLRSDAYRAMNAIPILVVSATFSGAEAEELTLLLGADGFLAAPYEGVQLSRTARDLLDNSRPIKWTNLLIVGAEEDSANQLAQAFSANGYAVSRAAGAGQALERMREAKPHVVIIDYDHAGPTVDRLIAKVKGPSVGAVVVVITADQSAEMTLRLMRQGADSYAHKPVTAEYLMHLCETAARQRALLRVEELLEMRTRKLRANEERYRALFENAGLGIVTYNLDGLVAGVNRQFEALTRLSRSDLTGKSYGRYMTPASHAEANARQAQARNRRESSWVYEGELVRSDGARIPVEAHCRFLRGAEAEPAMIMAMYRDLSSEKQLQRQRAEFTAMLAHDIRNPIGLILGCTDLLLEESELPDGEIVKECHRRIREDALVLLSLVSNYLDAARIEAGQLHLSKNPVKLGQLLGDLLARYSYVAQARSIRLEMSAQEIGQLSADPVALERVFTNLLGNALKFTPDGGHITVCAERRGAEVYVAVQDSGPGIDPQKQAVLFDKFTRLESREKRDGVGLGLYIVKELVAAHGGRVGVESALGSGSRFEVFLPLGGAPREL